MIAHLLFVEILLPVSQGSGSGDESIGTIIARPTTHFTSDSEAKKYLYCDGSTFSASLYPKLYNILGTNTLPDLRSRFLEGHNNPGIYFEAGLPNIFGKIGTLSNWPGYILEGAFGYDGVGSKLRNVDGDPKMNANFDASRCSPIYGRSTTVQPPAYTVRYYIRAK